MNFGNITQKKAAVGLIAVVAIAAIGAGASNLFGDESTQGLKNKASQQNSQQSSGSQKKTKLSNTRYSRYAFKISGSSLSSKAKRALAGFKVKKSTTKNGTVIHLNAKRPEYSDQTYKLKKGEQLYFIETSFGDDSRGKEYSMGDDTGVVVDSNGYIVRT